MASSSQSAGSQYATPDPRGWLRASSRGWKRLPREVGSKLFPFWAGVLRLVVPVARAAVDGAKGLDVEQAVGVVLQSGFRGRR